MTNLDRDPTAADLAADRVSARERAEALAEPARLALARAFGYHVVVAWWSAFAGHGTTARLREPFEPVRAVRLSRAMAALAGKDRNFSREVGCRVALRITSASRTSECCLARTERRTALLHAAAARRSPHRSGDGRRRRLATARVLDPRAAAALSWRPCATHRRNAGRVRAQICCKTSRSVCAVTRSTRCGLALASDARRGACCRRPVSAVAACPTSSRCATACGAAHRASVRSRDRNRHTGCGSMRLLAGD